MEPPDRLFDRQHGLSWNESGDFKNVRPSQFRQPATRRGTAFSQSRGWMSSGIPGEFDIVGGRCRRETGGHGHCHERTIVGDLVCSCDDDKGSLLRASVRGLNFRPDNRSLRQGSTGFGRGRHDSSDWNGFVFSFHQVCGG